MMGGPIPTYYIAPLPTSHFSLIPHDPFSHPTLPSPVVLLPPTNRRQVSLDLYWRGTGEPFENELRVLLSHGVFAVECNPKVQLWLRRDGEFSPLWASSIKYDTLHPQYKEQVDVRVEHTVGDGAEAQWDKTRKAGGTNSGRAGPL